MPPWADDDVKPGAHGASPDDLRERYSELRETIKREKRPKSAMKKGRMHGDSPPPIQGFPLAPYQKRAPAKKPPKSAMKKHKSLST